MQGICSENIFVGKVTNMMTASDKQRCSHSLSAIALPVTLQIDTLQPFKCPSLPFHFYLTTSISITFKAVTLYVLCKRQSFISKKPYLWLWELLYLQRGTYPYFSLVFKYVSKPFFKWLLFSFMAANLNISYGYTCLLLSSFFWFFLLQLQ